MSKMPMRRMSAQTVSASDTGSVDTLTSPSHVTVGYLSRSATYTPVSTSATLKFSLLCPRFMQLTAQSNYALIAITLTNSNKDLCPAKKIKK